MGIFISAGAYSAPEVMELSYRIDYGGPQPGEEKGPSPGLRRLVLSLCFFAVFVLLVHGFWPEGRQLLRSLLFGSRAESVLRCFETLAASLSEGQTLRDAAVGAFRDVIYGH